MSLGTRQSPRLSKKAAHRIETKETDESLNESKLTDQSEEDEELSRNRCTEYSSCFDQLNLNVNKKFKKKFIYFLLIYELKSIV